MHVLRRAGAHGAGARPGAGGEDDPPCRTCGGILKSATISFGQNLVAEDLQRAAEAAERCDLLLAVGTTLGVYPVANLVPIARMGVRGWSSSTANRPRWTTWPMPSCGARSATSFLALVTEHLRSSHPRICAGVTRVD